MKIITCASYHGTGSSAITDFFEEFSNCSSIGKYEMRFIHDPAGIRDLEYNLIENNNRFNTSNAIKDFKKFTHYINGNMVRKGYRNYMGKNFINLSDKYIDNITELVSNTYWYYDEYKRGELIRFLSAIFRRIYGLFNDITEKSVTKFLGEKSYYSAIDKDKFYKYTKEYITQILKCANTNNTEYVMVDQLLPPSNIQQYLPYFDYIKVFVVDRDPRDLFILSHRYWKTDIIPQKDVAEFCKWYEIIRRHRKREEINTKYSMFVQFEDLIYKYDEMRTKLIKFVGMDIKNHIKPKTKFDPAVSMNNTNLKLKYPEYKKEMAYIENNLKEYLYDFPSYKKNNN